jgi:hypothetical protein
MKRSTFRFIILASLVLSVASIIQSMTGCAGVQHAAEDVRYVAGGAPPSSQPTSQPSTEQTALDVARGTVGIAGAVMPPVKEIASIVALLAGAVAGIAGHLNGKRSGAKQTQTVVSEIIDDVAAFKQPNLPWTDATRKLLDDLGYGEEVTAQVPLNAPRSA